MSDETTPAVVESPKGTVGYTRKVNLGNYESEELSVFIQFPVTFDDEAATVAAANDATFQAKTVAFSQLGLATKYDDGVLTAIVQGVFPGAAVEPAGNVAAVSSQPAAPIAAASRPSDGSLACPKCGSGLYDNRPKNVDRLAAGQKALPEGRCKQYVDPPKGTGCKGVIWSYQKGA